MPENPPIVIGIELGSQTIAAALITSDNRVLVPMAVPTPLLDGLEAVQAILLHLCEELRAEATHKGMRVVGVGMGIGARVDETGSIHQTPSALQAWQGVNFAELLSEALDLPVVVEHDVNTIALEEFYLGVGEDYNTILYVNVGVSVGGALIRNGNIWRGAHGGAGDIGALVADWRGEKPVTLNEIASIPGIIRLYHTRSRNFERPAFDEIIRFAMEGNMLAVKVLRDAARTIGHILSPVVALIDPDILIIGGTVPLSGALWYETFLAAFAENPAIQTMPVAKARIQAHAVLLGAGRLVWEQVTSTA
jgi:glucokinase